MKGMNVHELNEFVKLIRENENLRNENEALKTIINHLEETIAFYEKELTTPEK